MSIIKRTIVIGMLIMLVVTSLACSSKELNSSSSQTITFSNDRNIAGDISGMAKQADHIYLGHYISKQEPWVMMKEPYYKEAVVYSFQVERTFLGNSEDIIQVAIPAFTKQLVKTEAESVEVTIPEPFGEPVINNQEYLIFVTKNEATGYFTPVVLPFHISFNKQGKSELQYAKNLETNQTITLTNNKVVHVDSEDYPIEELDTITGSTKSEIIELLNNYLKNKE